MKAPRHKPPPPLPSVDDAAIPAHRPGLLGQLFRLPELLWGAPPQPQSRLERGQSQARSILPDDHNPD